jgi:hypothetical protein
MNAQLVPSNPTKSVGLNVGPAIYSLKKNTVSQLLTTKFGKPPAPPPNVSFDRRYDTYRTERNLNRDRLLKTGLALQDDHLMSGPKDISRLKCALVRLGTAGELFPGGAQGVS